MKLIKKIIFALACYALSINATQTHQHQPQEVWITVFVHGIMSVQPHLSFETVLRLFQDRVEDSFYSHAVEAIRTDPFFHRNQAMQDLGLIPIDKNSMYAGDASCALATLFDQIYEWKYNHNADNHYYYTYGWSGLLSPTIRMKESKEFYKALGTELKKFHAQGIRPKVRLIGYSHGGNIVLGLAQGQREQLLDFEFFVDEVIFLGVPIQQDTDHYVHDPIFKKIYNLYSTSDRIQTIDCFSYKRLGSNQFFRPRPDLRLPKKLVQIEIKILRNTKSNRRKAKHKDKRYDFEDPAIVAGRTHGLRNASPGHCELWFFGWTHSHYRSHFPLTPLPLVAVLPHILETIKEVEHEFPCGEHIIADIRPHQEAMIIRTRNQYSSKKVFCFLSREQMEELKDKAREFSFKRVTYADYKEHIQAAFDKTREKLANRLFDAEQTCCLKK